MKYLDSLFRKMFGREKDNSVSFDEDALWDSIVEDLGPENSIVPKSSILKAWIAPAFIVGVVLLGALYMIANNMESDKGNTLLGENQIETTVNPTISEEVSKRENGPARYSEQSKLENSNRIDEGKDNPLSNQGSLSNISNTSNVTDAERTNFDQKTKAESKSKADKGVTVNSTEKEESSKVQLTNYTNAPDGRELYRDPVGGESNSSGSRPSVESKDENKQETELQEVISTAETSGENIEKSNAEQLNNDANAQDGREFFRDPKGNESSSSGSRPSFEMISFSELEVLETKLLQSHMSAVNKNSKNLVMQPIVELQPKLQNWKYSLDIFSGANLTDVSFRGQSSDVIETKNMTEQLGLGTQLGVDFMATYKSRWSLTSGLNATLLHTIYKDVSTTEMTEDQHQIDRVVLSQDYNIIEESTLTASLTRNIYRADIHNNYYQTITMPLLLGWQSRAGASSFGLKVGPQISYRYSQSGRTVDEKGIYRTFDGSEEALLKLWNIDLAGQLWFSLPITDRLDIRGAYHLRANDNTIFNFAEIQGRTLNNQLRIGLTLNL